MSDDVPVLPWSVARRRFDRWNPGDHVAIVGPTGCGKTTLVRAIIGRRKWVLWVITKRREEALPKLKREGWTVIRKWPPPALKRRVILWVPIKHLRSGGTRAGDIIAHALQATYDAGAWAIVLDDLQALLILARQLKADVQTLLLNARSNKQSIICCTQRPRHVPREVWAEATWFVIWGTSDEDDLRALPGLGGLNGRVLRQLVAALDHHQCLVVNASTRDLFVTRVS